LKLEGTLLEAVGLAICLLFLAFAAALIFLASTAQASWRPSTVVRQGVRLDRNGLIPRPLLRQALAGLKTHRGQVTDAHRIAVADLSRRSDEPRFYVLNLRDGSVRNLVTTHGKGSDPDQTGHAVRVSNTIGSLASSTGAYVTGETYDSPAHLSKAVRLDGLDPSNSNARCRCIVVHQANRSDGQNYASPEWIAAHVGADGRGQAGRSDGCFAFSGEDYPYVLSRLGPGVMIYAGPSALTQWTPDPAPSANCCPEAPPP
jgi:hypothetical protein